MIDVEQHLVDTIIHLIKMRGGGKDETALWLTAIRAFGAFLENIDRMTVALEKLAEMQRESRDMSAQTSKDVMKYMQMSLRTDQ